MALVDALHSREGSAGLSTARLLSPEVQEDLIEGLRQEINNLRQRLEVSEYSRRAAEERGQITQECQAALMREFSMLVQEVTSLPAALAWPHSTSRSASPSKPAAPAAPSASTRDVLAADVPAAALALSSTGSSPALSQVPQAPQAQPPGVQPPQATSTQPAQIPVTSSSTGGGAVHSGSQSGGGHLRVPQLRLPTKAVQGQPGAGQYPSSASYAPPPRLTLSGGYSTGPLTDRSSDRSSRREETLAWHASAEAAAQASARSHSGQAASAPAAVVAPISAAGRSSPAANAKVKMTPLRLNGLRA